MKTATAYFAGNHEYFDITLKCLFFEGLKMKAISQHSSSMETTNLAKRKKNTTKQLHDWSSAVKGIGSVACGIRGRRGSLSMVTAISLRSLLIANFTR